MNAPFAVDFFKWLLQASWQATVLAGLILLAQRLLRKQLSPGWRYGLWSLLLIRLVMPIQPQAAFSLFNLAKPLRASVEKQEQGSQRAPPSEPVPSLDTVGAEPSTDFTPAPRTVQSEPVTRVQRPDVPLARRWSFFEWASLVWFCGVALLGSRLLWTQHRFRTRIEQHEPITESDCLNLLRECQRVLGIRADVIVIETEEVSTPAVYGFFRKRLLLPDGMLERFPREELRYIFLHEMAHLKRRDLELNWLVTLLQVLHWFNPLLGFAFRRMRADRELATDALALSYSPAEANSAYGETILKVLEVASQPSALPGLVGIVESKAQLKERLRAIARYSNAKGKIWVVLGVMLVIGGLALTNAKPGSPQADSPQKAKPAEAKADISRSDARRVIVQVLDYDSGAPLAGARVAIEMEPAAEPKRELTTGDDGRVSIELPVERLKRFEYQISRPDYLSLYGDWHEQEISTLPADLSFKLSRGIVIGGTVTDAAGKPLAGASIFVDRPVHMILAQKPPWHSLMWSLQAGQQLAVTSADGTWRARCMWPKITLANFRIRHPDFADAIYGTEITKAMEAEGKGSAQDFASLTNYSAQFVLTPGVVVEGEVLNANGRAMPGVQVRYADRPSENPFWDDRMGKEFVQTDDTGHFQTRPLPRKTIFFAIQTKGYAPIVSELDLRLQQPKVTLHLEKGQRFSTRVQNQQGNPLPGVQVALEDGSIWQGVRFEAITDDEGGFAWEDAPREQFRLSFERDGFITKFKNVQRGDEEPVTLKEKLRLNGSITDAQTKKPIERFRLLWADREENFERSHRYAVPCTNGNYSINLAHIFGEGYSDKYFHSFLFRIEADGYLPATSRKFESKQDVGPVAYDLQLQRAQQIVGMVIDAEEHPVAGAQVALNRPGMFLRLAGRPRFEPLDRIDWPLTDANGQFQVNQDPAATHLVAVHEKGIGWIQAKELTGTASSATIHLKPWGRVEGTAWNYDQTLINEMIMLDSHSFDETRAFVSFRQGSVSDEHGHFVFQYVPPTRCALERMIPCGHFSSSGLRWPVDVEPGQTTEIKFGGAGRPVIGKFTIKNPSLPIDWMKDHQRVDMVSLPPPIELQTPKDRAAWRKPKDFYEPPRTPSRQRKDPIALTEARSYPIQFSEDGSFRIDEMLPGRYEFGLIRFYDPRDPDALAFSKYIELVNRPAPFEVPDRPDRDSLKPFDLGSIEIELKGPIQDGQQKAPQFVAVDMNGKELKLSDFAGKYVLLDFWATWCAPCIAELPYLRDAYDRFKERKDFAMISLSIDDAIDKPRDFAKKNNMPWLQAHLAEAARTKVQGDYGVRGIPAIFLINPEGKIISADLGGSAIGKELSKWLK